MRTYRKIIRLTGTESYWNGTQFTTTGTPATVETTAPSAREAEEALVEKWRGQGHNIECIAAF